MNVSALMCDDRLAGEYVADVKKFLAEFNWVYDWKLTRFFVDRIWERSPPDWLHAWQQLGTEQLSQIASSSEKAKLLPESLQHFISECRRLAISDRNPAVSIHSLPTYNRRKISAKKQHEFDQLLPRLVELFRKHQITEVVDIGCGIVRGCTKFQLFASTLRMPVSFALHSTKKF